MNVSALMVHAWERLTDRRYTKALLAGTGAFFACVFLLNVATSFFPEGPLHLIVQGVSFILMMYVFYAYIRLTYTIARQESLTIESIIIPWKEYRRFTIAYILYTIFLIALMLPFIGGLIPATVLFYQGALLPLALLMPLLTVLFLVGFGAAFFFSSTMQFFPYRIIDGYTESSPRLLLNSHAETKGYRWIVLGVFAVIMLTLALGAIALFIGLFAAVPYAFLLVAQTHISLRQKA